jgi:hypothetical protein
MKIQDIIDPYRLLATLCILALATGCGTVDSSVKKPVKKPAMVPAARWQESLPSGSFRSRRLSESPWCIAAATRGGQRPTGIH